MDWVSLGAMPVGMLMFGVTIFGAVRRKAGHVLAKSQYPALALELGLAYRPSRYRSGVGTLVGEYRGYGVTIDPDEQRRIILTLPQPPGVALWTEAHNRRPERGMRSFRPRRARVAAFFKTVQGTDAGARKLQDSPALEEAVKVLSRLRALRALSLTDRRMVAVFDFGSPPFIPADVLREVLPELVRVADSFQSDGKIPD